MTIAEWRNAQLHQPDGDMMVRFRADRSTMLGDPRYPAALWVQIDLPDTFDLDALLSQLDAAEDEIVHQLESENRAHLLLVLTGAGFRELVFAVGPNESSLIDSVRGCSCTSTLTVQARVFPEQKFGPFAKLVSYTN